jgi:N-acetylneuraminic acid mutarotase
MKRARFGRLLGAAALVPLTSARADAFDPGFWTPRAPIPDARVGPAVAATDAGIFVIGGFAARGERLNQRYETELNRWSDRSAPPVPLNYAAAAASGRWLYVFGGFSDTYAPKYRHALNDAYAYDTQADAWTKIAPMPTARGSACAVARRGLIHVFGGRGDAGALAVHEVYDPRTDAWDSFAPLPAARSGFGAVYLGGYIHVFGGNVALTDAFTGSHDRYDPIDDSWRSLTPMPGPRSNFGCGVLTNLIVAFGGTGMTGALRSAVRYEPERDNWSDLAEMPAPRQSFGAVRSGDAIYAVAGARTPGLVEPVQANEAFAFS